MGWPRPGSEMLWPGSENLAGAAVVVATPAVQSHLGARLETVDAPGIIARFGAGNRQIVIRVMAPRGAAAYRSALAADLSERKSSGAGPGQHARPCTCRPPRRGNWPRARSIARLMVAIADPAAKHPVQVVAFGDGGPGVPSAPLRSAELAYSGQRGQESAAGRTGHDEAPAPRYTGRRTSLRCGYATARPCCRSSSPRRAPSGCLAVAPRRPTPGSCRRPRR